MRALADKVADRLLNLRARRLLIESHGLEPRAAILCNERIPLRHGEGLQSHRIARQVPSEGDELASQYREDENEKKNDGYDKNSKNEQRRAEPIEPEPLKFENDGIEKIAENDTGGERGYC